MTMTMIVPVAMRMHVVLAQYIQTVVIPVRAADDCMYMVFQWLIVGQEQTRMVVKFNKNDGTLNPVIKRIIKPIAPDPAKVCLCHM